MKIFGHIDDVISKLSCDARVAKRKLNDLAHETTNAILDRIDGICKREQVHATRDEHVPTRDPLGCPLNRE